MQFWHSASTVLGFRTVPTTVLLIVVYAAIFSAVFVTDELPDVPKDQGGLNLDEAYADLHQIAARPHPYNSHSNDVVHSYILSRLQKVASRYSHVHISQDLVSNASWPVGSSYGVYFEGTNILVKIDGSDPEYQDKGGVLFSAHYDSVSTAPGVTDDGMGVATLMQMVEYLGQRRPKRTAIFNINNGEEDGLMGAYVFFKHPWSNITDTFLNLEGAAAGGRPILFRATSKVPLLSFLNVYVPHPHANVISADGFAQGLIRSETDYMVYAPYMEGLDFAFYRGRSKYHTKYDSVPGAAGGDKALWAMMEAVRGAGSALVNDDSTHSVKRAKNGQDAVYFELFAAVLIVLPIHVMFAINVVLLTAGPILLLILEYNKNIAVHRPPQQPDVAQGGGSRETIWQIWHSLKTLWLGDLWSVGKFWLAVVFGAVLQVLLVVGYVNLNPFIVYSHPYVVLVSLLSLAYLSTVLLLDLPIFVPYTRPDQQKLTILIQTYILTWLLLVVSTILLNEWSIGSSYFISAWNAVVLLGVTVGFLEGITGAKGFDRDSVEEEGDGEERITVRGVRYEEGGGEGGSAHLQNEEVETDPTEITPLIRQRRVRCPSATKKGDDEDQGASAWWILQLLLVVPIPVILVSHIMVLMIGSMSQTLSDGNSPTIVYAMTSLVSLLIILPLAPFSLKLHRILTIIVLIIFIISTLYNWILFPFSQDAPLKVYFQQTLELDLSNSRSVGQTSHGQVIRAVTTLTGVPKYVSTQVIPHLPSSWGKEIQCNSRTKRHGLTTCSWEGDLLPAPGGTTGLGISGPPAAHSDWLMVNATRTSSTSARISVKGRNTRSCRLYFDTDPITSCVVQDSSGGLTKGDGMPEGGLPYLQLWSRTWGQEFTVDVIWPSEGVQEGRVACEWTEYESATAGGGGSGGKIPALEEVLSFLPKWAVMTKATDGLVEAWGKLSV